MQKKFVIVNICYGVFMLAILFASRLQFRFKESSQAIKDLFYYGIDYGIIIGTGAYIFLLLYLLLIHIMSWLDCDVESKK